MTNADTLRELLEARACALRDAAANVPAGTSRSGLDVRETLLSHARAALAESRDVARMLPSEVRSELDSRRAGIRRAIGELDLRRG